MPSVYKNKKVDSNIEIENTSVDFNTFSYPEENINTCGFSGQILKKLRL